MTEDIQKLNEKVSEKKAVISSIKSEIARIIVGQDYMVERILIGLFTDGHILLEGVPGLAKTLSVETTAKVIGSSFKRIQFTPDLLPADILGTEVYYQKTGEFVTKKGPVFHNVILADEINRAPAKVQSALLEAMQEKQVTLGSQTYYLEKPFIVLATQNPLEQEGTYPLPEAQQDRFMMKLKVQYPKKEEEKQILNRLTEGVKIENIPLKKIIGNKDILEIREIVRSIYIDDNLKNYILDIVFKTREKSDYIQYGVSPRASLNLVMASKGKAFIEGRGYVVPDDIKAVVYDILRHRLLLSYEAEAEGMSVEEVIAGILEKIKLI
ncbi:MAG TPA: ATPase [Spirochaetia bacterium]|nr:MAG: ATPase [Spirochaetes bacterium GWB1_36_13]HCL57095.1 ATPase [Spirochaetia bacterium]